MEMSSASPMLLGLFPNETGVVIDGKSNASAGDDECESDGSNPAWYVIVEGIILTCVCVVGILGNIIVMKNAVVIAKLAKKNMICFFCLALVDGCVCMVRGSSLLYILFHRADDSGRVVCEIWALSITLVFMSIFTNMTIGVQRLTIIYSYEYHRKYFTVRNASVVLISFWLGILSLCVCMYKLFEFEASFYGRHKTCLISSSHLQLSVSEELLIRILVTSVFGLVPIVITTISYNLIIVNVCQTGLVKLESTNYSRVTTIAIVRVAVIVLFSSPFLFFCIIGPVYRETILPRMRYFDYLFCIQSTLTAFITMQDTDFRDTLSRHRRLTRTCQTGQSIVRRRGFFRECQHSQITSADMKTFKHTDVS